MLHSHFDACEARFGIQVESLPSDLNFISIFLYEKVDSQYLCHRDR